MRLFRATVQDVARIERCARDCCQEHGAAVGELDWPHYRSQWEGLVRSGAGAMFLYEALDGEIEGGIGMARYPDMLTGKWRAAQVFVYVRPEVRGQILFRRMLHTAEEWARETGCEDIVMPLLGTMPEGTREFYEADGYGVMQSTYRKKLNAKAQRKEDAKI